MAIYTASDKHLGGTEEDTVKKNTYYFGLVRKNVLITGAKGQLGQSIQSKSINQNTSFHFIYTDVDTLDICNKEHVIDFVKQHSIEYIINCAAYTNVDNAENNQDLAYNINSLGVENIVDAARKVDAKIIHISTDYVFDGTSDKPYKEDSNTNPLSVYGISKLKSEEIIKNYNHNSLIIRTSWLFSQYGNNFVKKICNLLVDKKTINIVNDQKGSPTYAEDLAEMILEILLQSQATEWPKGIYNFSNKGETTWFNFALTIKNIIQNNTTDINPISSIDYNSAAKRPNYSVLDTSKIESKFNIVIPTWENSLKRCLDKIKKENSI